MWRSAVKQPLVDPMRIRLPRGRVLEGEMLPDFEKERERVEGMMTRKPGTGGGERQPDELGCFRAAASPLKARLCLTSQTLIQVDGRRRSDRS
jgi:hypothetical protein